MGRHRFYDGAGDCRALLLRRGRFLRLLSRPQSRQAQSNRSVAVRIKENSHDPRVAQRGKPQPTTNYHGAQPPGSPLCAGFAHNGVEVPSAATEESSQADKSSTDSSIEGRTRNASRPQPDELKRHAEITSPACILFRSGASGKPEGLLLSQQTLLG